MPIFTRRNPYILIILFACIGYHCTSSGYKDKNFKRIQAEPQLNTDKSNDNDTTSDYWIKAINNRFTNHKKEPLPDSIVEYLRLSQYNLGYKKLYPSYRKHFDSNEVYLFSADLDDSEDNKYFYIFLVCIDSSAELIDNDQILVTNDKFDFHKESSSFLHLHNSYTEKRWDGEIGQELIDTVTIDVFYYVSPQEFSSILDLDQSKAHSLLKSLKRDTTNRYCSDSLLLKELKR